MAEMLYVLVNRDDERYAGLKLEEIHDYLINDYMFDAFGNIFDYFSYWDDSGQPDGCFFGADDPERMKDFVSTWNTVLLERASLMETKMHSLLTASGKDNMVQLIGCNEGTYMLWEMRQALCSLTDLFTYGQDRLYTNPEHEWFTKLPEDVVKDAVEHPEKYAVIQCFYH